MSRSDLFGIMPSGEEVRRYHLRSGGLTASVLNLGAIVQDLRLDGYPHSLVLGMNSVADYLGPARYFGAIVGRFANRIAAGKYAFDDQEVELDHNDQGANCLHGGSLGCDNQIWHVRSHSEHAIEMTLVLPDGQMGFPGNMKLGLRISLTDDSSLEFNIQAKSDLPSPCSFAHHGYFNLDGSPDIFGHLLKIDAQTYLPTDDTGIPVGDPRPVTGTRFDFRRFKAIEDTQLDHNFCLSMAQTDCRPVAKLTSPRSGIELTVETTEPGIQVYDAAQIPAEGLPGLGSSAYGPRAGLALETQCWPDAPNRPDFPNAILLPGQTYRHTVRYAFIRGTSSDPANANSSGDLA